MSVSLRKAITKEECAVKKKHIDSIISETFSVKGEKKFWSYVEKLALSRNHILAWKFCHILHRILTEGHPRALQYAQKKRGIIIDLGHNWSLLQTNYANEIQIYTELLEMKLKFHARFPQLPGNLKISSDDLRKIGGESISTFGEIAIMITDYLQHIYELRTSIFKTYKRSKCTSMTPAGQCRLEPVALCFQDTVRLHDTIMEILTLSPSCLPMKLTDYRERYRMQIKSFRKSFEKSMKYQYLNDVIPKEVKDSIKFQESLEPFEGNEASVAEMVIESRRTRQSMEQRRNENIFNETISGLENLNQQFTNILSTAKQTIGTAGLLTKKEETQSKNKLTKVQEFQKDFETVKSRVTVDVREDTKNRINESNAVFEKKFEEFLERYVAEKMQNNKTEEKENHKTEENEKIKTTEAIYYHDRKCSLPTDETTTKEASKPKYSSPNLERLAQKIIELLVLLTRPTTKKTTGKVFNPTPLLEGHLHEFEQVVIKKTQQVAQNNQHGLSLLGLDRQDPNFSSWEPASDLGDYNFLDQDADENITILAQRLQQLLDHMYSVEFVHQDYGFLGEKTPPFNESLQSADIGSNASTISVESEQSQQESSLKDDPIDDDFNTEKITLKDILEEVLKLQDIIKENKN